MVDHIRGKRTSHPGDKPDEQVHVHVRCHERAKVHREEVLHESDPCIEKRTQHNGLQTDGYDVDHRRGKTRHDVAQAEGNEHRGEQQQERFAVEVFSPLELPEHPVEREEHRKYHHDIPQRRSPKAILVSLRIVDLPQGLQDIVRVVGHRLVFADDQFPARHKTIIGGYFVETLRESGLGQVDVVADVGGEHRLEKRQHPLGILRGDARRPKTSSGIFQGRIRGIEFGKDHLLLPVVLQEGYQFVAAANNPGSRLGDYSPGHDPFEKPPAGFLQAFDVALRLGEHRGKIVLVLAQYGRRDRIRIHEIMPAGRADLFPFGAELLVGFGQHKVKRCRQVVVLPGLPPAVIVLEAMVFGDDQHHRKGCNQKQGQLEHPASVRLQESPDCPPQTFPPVANLLHTVCFFFCSDKQK